MNDRVTEFKVGVVVIASFLILAILILLNSQRLPFLSPGRYTIYVNLPQAPGISENTPVRKNGITIGRVESVAFGEDGGVRLAVAIDKDVEIFQGDVPRVKGSLLGDSVLDFEPGPRAAQRQVLPANGEMEGVVVADPLDILASLQDNLTTAIDSLGGAGESVTRLADRIDNLLAVNDDQFQRIAQKTETALDNFNTAMSGIEDLIGDETFRENLKKSLEGLPELLQESRTIVEDAQRTVRSAEENLDNLKGFTGPLGERGPEIINDVDKAVTSLDDLLEQIAELVSAANNPDGSVRQFLDNPDLYQNLNHAASNIEQASRELRPTLANLRVFTDKIARDPGRLGVSGVLRRETGLK